MRVDRGEGSGALPWPVPRASVQNDKSMKAREVPAGKAISVRQPGGWPEWPCLPGEGTGPGGENSLVCGHFQ